jgi:hypothetical protein
VSARYATHLDLLLDRLTSGYLSAIEYAGPAVGGVHTSIFQIRYLATASGMQYAVRTWDDNVCENWVYFPTAARTELALEVQSLIARAEHEERKAQIRAHGRRKVPGNVGPLPYSLRGVVSLRARDVAQVARRDAYLLDRLAQRWSNDD